jgi:hypothetical protein
LHGLFEASKTAVRHARRCEREFVEYYAHQGGRVQDLARFAPKILPANGLRRDDRCGSMFGQVGMVDFRSRRRDLDCQWLDGFTEYRIFTT